MLLPLLRLCQKYCWCSNCMFHNQHLLLNCKLQRSRSDSSSPTTVLLSKVELNIQWYIRNFKRSSNGVFATNHRRSSTYGVTCGAAPGAPSGTDALTRQCVGKESAQDTSVAGWDLVTGARRAQKVEEKRMKNLLFTGPPTLSWALHSWSHLRSTPSTVNLNV